MEGTGSFLLFLTNSQGIEKGFCKKTINLLTWHASNPLHIVV